MPANAPTASRTPIRGNAIIGLVIVTIAVVGLVVWSTRDPSPQTDIPTSALSRAEAEGIAASYFAGWNEGEYAKFGRDFDPAMRAGITKDAFLDFRDGAYPLIGSYERTTSVELVAARQAGFVTWVFDAVFEKDPDVEVRLTFPAEGTEIAGAHILSEVLGTK